MHETAGETLPCQNIFIALPLPVRARSLPFAPFFHRRPRRYVSRLCCPFIRLLPTCISLRALSRESRSLLLVASRSVHHRARTCTRTLARRVLHVALSLLLAQGRIFISADRDYTRSRERSLSSRLSCCTKRLVDEIITTNKSIFLDSTGHSAQTEEKYIVYR